MRVLFDADLAMNLADYGIEIPVSSYNAERTVEILRSASPGSDESWLISRFDERLTRADLLRVHDPGYVDRLLGPGLEQEIVRAFELIRPDGSYHRYNPAEARRPLSLLFAKILDRAAGTYRACLEALTVADCFFLGGGFHHAQYDYGDGFCLINDLVIAARRLADERGLGLVWVIDVDAHKGDGTAALTQADPIIRTLSIHMGAGWPLDKPEHTADGRIHPSFTPSTVDIPVFAGEDDAYLPRLATGLQQLAQYSQRVDGRTRPDLAIVVNGVDPYEHDALPSATLLRLNRTQMNQRDRLVYEFLRDVPKAYVMAGNYGTRGWEIYTDFLLNCGTW